MRDATDEPELIHEIADLKTLEILVDPLRTRILNLLIRSPLTVKEIASQLGIPTTRL